MENIFKRLLPLCLVGLLSLNSCRDEVDMSDMYTFLGQTITDYVKADSSLTIFSHVLEIAKVKDSAKSTIGTLLSARGNYTVFAPSDDAIRLFLDSIYGHKPYDIDTMSLFTANKIALNCILDHGNDPAMMSTDFVTGAIDQTTFNDRLILVSFSALEGGELGIFLNSTSRITTPDIELTNGIVHKVNRVISQSTASLSALLSQIDNMRIFNYLLEKTGWADSMVKYRDEDYEHIPNNLRDRHIGLSWQDYKSPEHRYYGYTAFVETDDVFTKDWMVPAPIINNESVQNWDEIMDVIKQRCAEAYPNAKSDDLTSEDNAVNQFVSYHLINYRVPFNRLVNHLTELGYYYQLPDQLSIDVWEYYLSMGKQKRMFKITQPALTGTMNINRHATYDNSFFGDYRQLSCDREGVEIYPTNPGHQNIALNGIYFPINHVMIYDDDVPNVVLNERIRYDGMATMPELMTNNIRKPGKRDPYNVPPMFVDGFTYTDETQCSMISMGEGWVNWQGDELIFYGQVDVTFKLLPVPFDGTWEIRIACANVGSRIMGQLYFGTNPLNLTAIGLPVDFRMSTRSHAIDWILDTNDEEENLENDKHMRNKSYMKGPQYCCANTYTAPMTQPLRNYVGTLTGLRRIVYQGHMEHDQTYYIRIKSVLEGTGNGLDIDYVEMVPKWVYNGPQGEDIW